MDQSSYEQTDRKGDNNTVLLNYKSSSIAKDQGILSVWYNWSEFGDAGVSLGKFALHSPGLKLCPKFFLFTIKYAAKQKGKDLWKRVPLMIIIV